MRTAASIATSLIAGVVLAASLTACTQAPTSTPSETPTDSAAGSQVECATSGDVSDAVTVTGDFGAKPTVTFTAPLAVDTTQVTTVIEGTGAVVEPTDTVNTDFSLYNGTTGAEVTSVASPYDGKNYGQFSADETQTLVGLARTLNCATIGSRVVGVIPPAEAWGDSGQTDLAIAGTDPIVFVIDVVSVVVPTAVEAYADMTDMPTVVFGDDGIPVVTMPEGVAAPETTRIGLIKEGDGDVVKSGDSVTVNYHGVLWDDGTVFDSSYVSGTPATFTTTGVVPGFKEALEGQKVGSQLISVVAPADGYGASGSGSIPANATLVFVIDIISIG